MKFSRIRTTASLIVLVAGALSLNACAGSPAAKTESADGGAYSIGIVSFSQASSASNYFVVGLQEVAKEKGWTTTLIDAQGAPDKAISAIQNLVGKKVDAIYYTVFPANAMAAGVLTAKAAGIPVANAGGGLGDGVQATYDFGYAEGQASMKEVLADLPHGGNLLALGYDLGGPCSARDQAMREATKGTAINVTFQQVSVPGQVQSGQQYAQAWLAAHPAGSGTNVIWSCFDDPAQGAIAAVKAAGRTDVTIHGLDGPPANLRAIQAGDQASTVWIDAHGAGRIAAEALPQIIANGVDGQKTVDEVAPFTVVTTKNIDAFLAKHPEALNE